MEHLVLEVAEKTGEVIACDLGEVNTVPGFLQRLDTIAAEVLNRGAPYSSPRCRAPRYRGGSRCRFAAAQQASTLQHGPRRHRRQAARQPLSLGPLAAQKVRGGPSPRMLPRVIGGPGGAGYLEFAMKRVWQAAPVRVDLNQSDKKRFAVRLMRRSPARTRRTAAPLSTVESSTGNLVQARVYHGAAVRTTRRHVRRSVRRGY